LRTWLYKDGAKAHFIIVVVDSRCPNWKKHVLVSAREEKVHDCGHHLAAIRNHECLEATCRRDRNWRRVHSAEAAGITSLGERAAERDAKARRTVALFDYQNAGAIHEMRQQALLR
jgi:hypothetical protein